MISRTVFGTKVTAKVVDKNTDEVSTYEAVVAKIAEDAKTAGKVLAKVLPDNLVIIKVVSFEKVETLYGMTVAEFMAHAVELDPVTRKPVAAEAETEAAEEAEN